MEKSKILKRFLNKTMMTNDEWDALQKDVMDGESKFIVCTKWGIKSHYYKLLKEYILGK